MNKCILLISEYAEIEELGLGLPFPDLEYLLPVIIICCMSILCAVLWLLFILEYVWLKGRKPRYD